MAPVAKAALILAIESDKKQATRLAALARDPLGAELVIGESTDEAFELLGDRHPDLILTSLLLSPRDESALAEHLREFDAEGWKVQTLVIPVFGSAGRSKNQSSGLLTRLRKTSSRESSSRGCDPQVFAEQITEYLERAAAERIVALEDAEALAAHPPVLEAAPQGAAEAAIDPDTEFVASFDLVEHPQFEVVSEPEFEVVSDVPEEMGLEAAAAETEDEAVEIPLDDITETPEPEPLPVPAAVVIEEPEPVVPAAILIEEPEIELPEIEIITADGDEAPAIIPQAAHHETVVRPEHVEPRSTWQDATLDQLSSAGVAIAADAVMAESDDPSLVMGDSIDLGFIEEVAMSAQFVGTPIDAMPATAPDPVQVPDAAPIVFPEPPPVVTAAPPPPPPPVISRPDLKVGPTQPVKSSKKKDPVAAVAPVARPAKPVPAPVPPAAPKRPALVQQPPDALRLVWAWPRLEGASSDADFAAFATGEPLEDRVAALAPVAETRETAKSRGKPRKEESRKKKKQAPPQDEWGFFDPEQCGFAALVAKLDELALDELGKDEPSPSNRK